MTNEEFKAIIDPFLEALEKQKLSFIIAIYDPKDCTETRCTRAPYSWLLGTCHILSAVAEKAFIESAGNSAKAEVRN